MWRKLIFDDLVDICLSVHIAEKCSIELGKYHLFIICSVNIWNQLSLIKYHRNKFLVMKYICCFYCCFVSFGSFAEIYWSVSNWNLNFLRNFQASPNSREQGTNIYDCLRQEDWYWCFCDNFCVFVFIKVSWNFFPFGE